jgi:hypothetical protein
MSTRRLSGGLPALGIGRPRDRRPPSDRIQDMDQ